MCVSRPTAVKFKNLTPTLWRYFLLNLYTAMIIFSIKNRFILTSLCRCKSSQNSITVIVTSVPLAYVESSVVFSSIFRTCESWLARVKKKAKERSNKQERERQWATGSKGDRTGRRVYRKQEASASAVSRLYTSRTARRSVPKPPERNVWTG